MKESNENMLLSYLLIDELVKNNFGHFVISPGMRSAPLVAGVVSHPKASIKICFDERAAAYYALGYSCKSAIKNNDQMAVLICTSGTALSNYYPAILEACSSGKSFVVLSADRPKNLVLSNANQTLDQEYFYQKHLEKSLSFSLKEMALNPKTILAKIDEFLFFDKDKEHISPIHLNIRISDPLYPKNEEIDPFLKNFFESRTKQKSLLKKHFSLATLKKDFSFFNQKIPSWGLLCFGYEEKLDVSFEHLKGFLLNLNWPCYFDGSSSFNYQFNEEIKGVSVIPSFDDPLFFNFFSENPPEEIWHFGDTFISKKIYELFLLFKKRVPNFKYRHFSCSKSLQDPMEIVDERFFISTKEVISNCFTTKMMNYSRGKTLRISFYHEKLQSLLEEKRSFFQEFYKNQEKFISTQHVSYELLKRLPSGFDLFSGNSLIIRAFDSSGFLSCLGSDPSFLFSCHRGVSGIEGFIASAVGVAEKRGRPCFLVLGDISFLHDLNSLALLKEAAAPVIILILNNGGGKIFTKLPIANFEEILSPCLVTPHNHDLNRISRGFGLPSRKIKTVNEFYDAIDQAHKNPQSSILEIIVTECAKFL